MFKISHTSTAVAVLAGLSAAGTTGAARAETADTVTCTAPVGPKDSAKDLMKRFGADAAFAKKVVGEEGTEIKVLVLYPKSPDRRLEIAFADKAMTRPSDVTATLSRGTAPHRWSIAGIAVGAGPAVVQKVNGKPFRIAGFGWDYGGYVNDWKSGALGQPLAGGCTLSVRFGGENPPDALSGDGVSVASDDKRLLKWGPVVESIVMSFPEK